MITVAQPEDLASYVGKELGTSAWRSIDEDDIAAFARLTGDDHWIHTDPERAGRETPFGGVIAHGFFTLALITALSRQCYAVTDVARWLNYGLDRVRFTMPITPRDRVRLKASLAGLEAVERGATRLRISCVLEIDGKAKPALVADWTMIAYT
jgi:acyl dehydratase